MNELDAIGEMVQNHMEVLNDHRENAIKVSRQLTRKCALTIRTIHRQEWEEVKAQLQVLRDVAKTFVSLQKEHPDLYYAGYTQDALKEYVEAHLTYVIIKDKPLPTPEELEVIPSTYMNGLAEAGTELRRYVLDIMRDGYHEEAERMLDAMQAIYTLLTTIDYPDAITGGLRRRTDLLRSVLERTRGELTMSMRQSRLQDALQTMAKQLNLDTEE